MEFLNRPADQWRPPIDKYYKVDNDAYQLIFEQAKKRFEDILGESQSITEKSIKMLTWLGALAGFYVGALLRDKPHNPALFFPALFFAVEAVLLLMLIIPKKIMNRGIAPDGGIPKELDNEEWQYQAKLVYFYHLVILQDNITYMRARNERRSRLYLCAQMLLLLLVTAVAAIISALLWGSLRGS